MLIITLVLILIGVVSTQSLIEKRRFIVVGCFFVAMFVTPPDALSMIMLAVPMWMLFEIGLLFGKITIDTVKEVVTISNLSKSSLDDIETNISQFMMKEKLKYKDRIV